MQTGSPRWPPALVALAAVLSTAGCGPAQPPNPSTGRAVAQVLQATDAVRDAARQGQQDPRSTPEQWAAAGQILQATADLHNQASQLLKQWNHPVATKNHANGSLIAQSLLAVEDLRKAEAVLASNPNQQTDRLLPSLAATSEAISTLATKLTLANPSRPAALTPHQTPTKPSPNALMTSRG